MDNGMPVLCNGRTNVKKHITFIIRLKDNIKENDELKRLQLFMLTLLEAKT